jgi:predicted nucleotidyltransferase
MTIKVKNLQTLAKKENLEEKIAKICEENNIIFMALFGSFVTGDQKNEVTLLGRLNG